MTVLNEFVHDARVRREASALAAAGHEVLVLALHGEGLPQQERTDGFDVIRMPLRTRSWPTSSLTFGLKYAEYFVRTLRAALAWQADVYHAHNANTLAIASLTARLRRAKLVYDAHELETGRNWTATHLSGLIRTLWSMPERLFILRADAVITVCDSIADELQQLYRIDRPSVVRNVPPRLEALEPVDLRERLGLSDDTRLVLYQGGMKANRGIEQMIEAIRELDRAALVILGGGPLLEPMKERVRRQGLEDRVFFLGYVPLQCLPRYTTSADIGIHLIQNSCLNHYWCLPNKLFEYIQAGLPVVVSHFPEMARIVRQYNVGELVNPSTPEEVAAGIRRVLSDESNCRKLRDNALRAATSLNWQRESLKLLQVYESLATRHS